MDSFQIFVMLMFAAAILVGMSQKIHIPYPIGLVLGGAAIGFMPNQYAINFDPNVILVIVLPPILYYAAFGISIRDFKRNFRDILSLALGLVAFTTLVIGLIFKWIFPEFPWALAFAFGAIVSPPDAIAATAILKRFAISNRLLTVLEGESLINDASALVLYKLAVVALLSGTFSFSEGSIAFVKTVSGGIAVGLVTGYFIQTFSRRYLEPAVGVVFSFTIPYITYIAADFMGVSGVLAVVVNGLMGSQILLRHHSSLRRILGYAAWDIFIILMNCFVFILIGLQLRNLTSVISQKLLLLYTGYAIGIAFVMVLIRMFWIYTKRGIAYMQALNNPKANTLCPQILREAALMGWSGMRGIVSLTAALALPYVLPNGMPLEGRNEVVFITFVVIFLTLIIPGLTLPSLIRWLNIHHHAAHHDALRVKGQLMKVAEETLHRLRAQRDINDSEFEFLTGYFNLKLRILEISTSGDEKLQNLEFARSKVIQEQRKKLFELWERLEIEDKLLGQLEHELDLEETHVARAELK